MSSALADCLEVWGVEENTVIFSDGSLGFCLDVAPTDVSCVDTDHCNDLHQELCKLLNSLPSGIDVQFIQEIKSGNDKVIDEYEKLCHRAKSKLIKELSLKRVESLKSLDSEGLLPVHTLKLLVRKSPEKSLLSKKSILSKESLFQKTSESNLRFEIKSLNRIKSDMVQLLSGLGLKTKEVSTDEIVNELYKQWNPLRAVELDEYDPTDLRDTILFTSVCPSISNFSIGEMHHKVISLKILPGQTYATMASVLRGLPFDSKLFLSINVPDQGKEIASLQTQRRLAFSMVYGKQTGVSDLESEAKLQDLEELTAQLISQGEKIFHFGLNVLLRSKSLDDLDDQVAQTLMSLRELGGAEGMEETIESFNIFKSFSFPNARVSERSKRIKTSNLADLLPIYGPWVGHAEPKIILRSRMGNLFKFNPFSSDMTNANQIISGGSGSGKSFLTNLLLIQMLKENPQIFIVDIGGSYKKTCDNLQGQYIPLGVDQGITINPFDLGPGETIPSSEKIKFLLALIESMTKEETDSGLKKLERSEIEQAILELYATESNPKLTHLKNSLLNHPEIELKRIGKILKSWCGDSPYGRFLDRDTTVDFHKSTVCFDLKGLELYPDLQSACLLMISDLVVRTTQKDKTKMKFLVFDECWALLDGEGANFIGSIFRTCRKYFMSCIAISQNIDDFAKSSVASAIMTNSSTKWLLTQRGADKERLKSVLELNDSEIALISSLHQVSGSYSEGFLMCENKKSVVVVDCTPYEYWLATTAPKDLALMESEKENHPELDQEKLIFHLAELYPQGANS